MGATSSARQGGQNAVKQLWTYRLISSLLRLVCDPKFSPHIGHRPFNPHHPTILVVSHEASITGAPVLALNLCQHLCESNNVVVLLMKGGDLVEDFQQYAVRVLEVSKGHLEKYVCFAKNSLKACTRIIRARPHSECGGNSTSVTATSIADSTPHQRGIAHPPIRKPGLEKINRLKRLSMRRRSELKAKCIELYEKLLSKLLALELKQPSGQELPKYAFVNTLVAAPWLGPLRSLGIAPITLIHEFSAYTRPAGLIDTVGLLSSKLVFSCELTRKDAAANHPLLQSRSMHVLAQGLCKLPERQRQNRDGRSNLADEAERFLQGLAPETILIVGAGAVQLRKGVDHFISVADQMRAQCPNQRLKFAWIGSGYDPVNDFHVSLWLKDQIERCGLNDQLHIFDQSPAYAKLLRRANIFLLPSRLDPLPNVAIDALSEGKVVLCFNKACGIADLLLSDQALGKACVAPYLDTAVMTEQAAALVNDPARLIELGNRGQKLARVWFNMHEYIDSLQVLGECAASEIRDLERQLERLIKFDAIDWSYHPWAASLTTRACTERYLLSWRNWSTPRKPFRGFHPGIYREERMVGQENTDPLLHYLETGKPRGPWNAPLITPDNKFEDIGTDVKVALHIHVHYPELLDPMIGALASNQLRPDLFITTSNREHAAKLHHQVEWHGLRISQLIIVPNRGRNIGALLTELGRHLDREYTFYGHLHTNNSEFIPAETECIWRDSLIANLLGDEKTVMADRIVAAMLANHELGLVFPDDPHCLNWGSHYDQARHLAARLGLRTLPKALNFPIGSMFWARQGALLPLYDLGMNWEEYPEESLVHGSALLDTIERIIPLVSQAQGYSYSLTYIPGINR